MSDSAFEALKTAFQQHVIWLQSQAAAHEHGKCQYSEQVDGNTCDTPLEISEQFQHQANNLQAVLAAYERLRAKAADDSSS